MTVQFATTPDPSVPPPSVPPPPVGPPPAAPPPVDNYHEQQASKFLEVFEGLRSGMDPLALPHPTTEKFVQGYRFVPVAFNDEVIWQTAQTPDLQALNRLNVDEARNAQQYNQAWKRVLDEVNKFGSALQFQIGLNHATVSAAALQTYAAGKALARDPGSTDVRVAVKYIARYFKGRGLPKNPPQSPQPTPAPVPPHVPATFDGIPITGKESPMNH
jgi:hypothetical protein